MPRGSSRSGQIRGLFGWIKGRVPTQWISTVQVARPVFLGKIILLEELRPVGLAGCEGCL